MRKHARTNLSALPYLGRPHFRVLPSSLLPSRHGFLYVKVIIHCHQKPENREHRLVAPRLAKIQHMRVA
eukprot:48090-Eustigmatos_ZCMA.PRE.1